MKFFIDTANLNEIKEAYPSRITLLVKGENDAAIFLVAKDSSISFYGIKQASSFPSNMEKGVSTVFADIHLYSTETGEPVAVVSANLLTAMKTGAGSAVATKFLAKEGEAGLAIIGTGVQAGTQLDGIQRVRPLKEVRLYDIDIAGHSDLPNVSGKSGMPTTGWS